MMRSVVTVLILSAFAIGPMLAHPAAAADVSVTLVGFGFGWHVGSETSTQTQISVTVGDRLLLRIENHDTGGGADHTFTVPQFPVASIAEGQVGGDNFLNLSVPVGAVRFWNHTVTSADVGNWQYYCHPHSVGTYPNRTSMVGVLGFQQPAPPPTPGFEVVVALSAVVAAFVAVRVLRKK